MTRCGRRGSLGDNDKESCDWRLPTRPDSREKPASHNEAEAKPALFTVDVAATADGHQRAPRTPASGHHTSREAGRRDQATLEDTDPDRKLQLPTI